MRETSDYSQVVVHANRTNASGTELFDLTLFQFDKEDNLEKRIYATQGRINRDYWELENAKIWSYSSKSAQEKTIEFLQQPYFSVKTNLTQDQILNNFSDPRAISFWSIPNFVKKLEISGFSATRHKLFYQNEISRPFFLVAMMLIGAAFSLNENQTSNLLEGNSGVYKIFLIKKNQAIDIGNYQNFGLSVRDSKDQNIPESVFKALNSVSKIEDNRALYY